MQIAVVVRVFDGLVAYVVGGSVDHAPFDAATGKPGGVATRVVVAPGRVLGPGAAAELAGPHDERLVEHAALLQVADQAGDRLVGRPAERRMALHVAVRVPGSVAAAGVADLDEADAPFRQPACQEKLPAEVVGLLGADAVEIQHVPGFVREIDDLRRRQLHPRGQFVSLSAGRDVRV